MKPEKEIERERRRGRWRKGKKCRKQEGRLCEKFKKTVEKVVTLRVLESDI